ncbi:hypothetical protein V1281_004342 [Nitrobacteraceae bacterium AZCC 2161]
MIRSLTPSRAGRGEDHAQMRSRLAFFRSPPGGGEPDYLPELQVLTTNNEFAVGVAPFVEFHDTSAACALAANLATKLVARYPDYSRETVRGFMVHWSGPLRADRIRSLLD